MEYLDPDDENYGGDLIPCEFCNELFPFEEIIQHQSGCDPELVHFNFQQLQDAIPSSPPHQVADKMKDSLKLDSPSIETEPEVKLITPPVKIEEDNISIEKSIEKNLEQFQKEDINLLTQTHKSVANEDFFSQEDETKLMSYGTKTKKKVEEERQRFKVPSLPLINTPSKKVEVQLNSLSDDEDGEETLENFWAKAEIKLDKMLNKNH